MKEAWIGDSLKGNQSHPALRSLAGASQVQGTKHSLWLPQQLTTMTLMQIKRSTPKHTCSS